MLYKHEILKFLPRNDGISFFKTVMKHDLKKVHVFENRHLYACKLVLTDIIQVDL